MCLSYRESVSLKKWSAVACGPVPRNESQEHFPCGPSSPSPAKVLLSPPNASLKDSVIDYRNIGIYLYIRKCHRDPCFETR